MSGIITAGIGGSGTIPQFLTMGLFGNVIIWDGLAELCWHLEKPTIAVKVLEQPRIQVSPFPREPEPCPLN